MLFLPHECHALIAKTSQFDKICGLPQHCLSWFKPGFTNIPSQPGTLLAWLQVLV